MDAAVVVEETAAGPLCYGCAHVVTEPPPRALRSTLRVVLRPFAWLAAASLVLHLATEAPPEGADRTAALRHALARQGLTADSIAWADPPPHVGQLARLDPQFAWVLARKSDEARDVYLAKVWLTPEGGLWRVLGVFNVTETAAADERGLVTQGRIGAWTLGSPEKTFTVQLADLTQQTLPTGPEWTRLAQWQHRVTNWQSTGLPMGVARRTFRLDPPANTLIASLSADALSLHADEHDIVVPVRPGPPLAGGQYVREQQHPPALPGNLVTWAVNRVRQLAWFGDEKMQVLKAVVYAAADFLRRHGASFSDPAESDIEDDFGASYQDPAPSTADPETGWPPAPLPLVLPPAFEGEGKWRSLREDPFALSNPGLPESLVTTFLRTDKERKFSRIYIAAWDPRQVELHVMTGTKEPKSATGETGTGLIPRDPETMTRLVGAFNGGFQTTHGAFGIQADDTLFVPPIPFAATVARRRDGSTLFGTWPEQDSVPDDLTDFRQNLTPLVAGEKLNPYGRIWWGGVPQGWEDDTRTVRSGLCLTKHGHVVYFYGNSVDHKHLGKAMLQADCTYGLHLDMNQGHTGMEIYRVAAEADLPLLTDHLDSVWKEQGSVPDLPGYRFRGRRLVRSMRLMHFPRYIKRQSRDFFYLTLRHLLPGNAVDLRNAPREGDEGQWRVTELPQHGFPYAIATTHFRPDPARPQTKVRVAKLDAKFLSLVTSAPSHLVVSLSPPTGTSGTAVWLRGGDFVIAEAAPDDATLLARRTEEAPTAAFGVGERDGMLYYVEIATGRNVEQDATLLRDTLRTLGCPDAVLSSAGTLSVGGTRDLSGHPSLGARALHLVRSKGPGAGALFPDTPVVPRDKWRPLQSSRTSGEK